MNKSESDVDNLIGWLSFLEARASNYNSITSTTVTIAITFILSIVVSFTELIGQAWIKYSLIGVLGILLSIYVWVIRQVGIPWIKALQAKKIADKIIRGKLKTSEDVRKECMKELLKNDIED